MHLNIKKLIILVLTNIILFYILTSEVVLPSVTISVKDASIISIFIIFCSTYSSILSLVEHKKLENKILRQHAQMQTILNATPLVMYLKDTDGKIILSNKNHAELFGLTREDIIGKSCYSLYQDSDVHRNEDQDIIKKKEGKVVERRAQLANGISGWFRAIKMPVINPQNGVEGIVVIFQNITDEKELEKRKDTFVATLTHDLKTPTIAQIRALELLLCNSFGALNDEQREMVMQIKNSCQYMNDLIFTILDTYLYDNGQTKIYPEEFDVVELIKHTVQDLANLVEEKNQNIKIICNLSESTIIADKVQMKRVLTNFIGNAISHGFKDSTIEIAVEDNELETIFNVKNKANYIQQELLAEMYEKFTSAESSKYNNISTGLGLYLSKQIIDAHNGRVFAKSNEDETCVFGFSLPKTLQKATPRNRLQKAV